MRDNYSERELDERLESASQLKIRAAVQALPEEPVSLAWRSELNSNLRAQVARKRRMDLFAWVWKPAAGVALAAALAVPFLAREPAMVPVKPDVEKALVNNYVEDASSWDVAAEGVTAGEAKEAPVARPAFDIEPEDVGATL